MSALQLNAEDLYLQLRKGVQALWQAHSVLVGVYSGGVWLAERLQKDLGLPHHGKISSALHRDDFSSRGLVSSGVQTHLPFSVDGQAVVLIDDVLNSGRTTRAVLNELFDFGRPASVQLAVLVDRGGRELPMAASYAAAQITLPAHQKLSLERDAQGQLAFRIEDKSSKEGLA